MKLVIANLANFAKFIICFEVRRFTLFKKFWNLNPKISLLLQKAPRGLPIISKKYQETDGLIIWMPINHARKNDFLKRLQKNRS